MQKVQKGFTLIELIVVIVLLGILGVTALGKFQDLSSNAQEAAIEGIASELSSAAAINYAAGTLSGTYAVTLTAADVCTTAILEDLFQSAAWPDQTPAYALNGTGDCTTAGAGGSVACTIFQDTSATTVGYDANDVQASISLVCSG